MTKPKVNEEVICIDIPSLVKIVSDSENFIDIVIPFCSIIKQSDRYRIGIPSTILDKNPELRNRIEKVRELINKGEYILIVKISCIRLSERINKKKRIKRSEQIIPIPIQ